MVPVCVLCVSRCIKKRSDEKTCAMRFQMNRYGKHIETAKCAHEGMWGR